MTHVPSVRILRQENGGPASQVKELLIKELVATPSVRRAYLVDTDYGVDHNVACAIEFDPSVNQSDRKAVIKRLLDSVGPIFKPTKLSMDFLDLTPKTTIPDGVEPFYDRPLR